MSGYYQDLIETTLTPDPDDVSTHFKADIVFKCRSCDGNPEVEILNVLPLGIVPPMDKDRLMKLAHDWLEKGGGYEACCQRAKEATADWLEDWE